MHKAPLVTTIALGSMSICPCNFMPIILYLIAYRLQCFINVSISCWISAPMVDLKKSLFLVPLILIPSIGTQKIIKCGGDKISWLHDSPSDNLLLQVGSCPAPLTMSTPSLVKTPRKRLMWPLGKPAVMSADRSPAASTGPGTRTPPPPRTSSAPPCRGMATLMRMTGLCPEIGIVEVQDRG